MHSLHRVARVFLNADVHYEHYGVCFLIYLSMISSDVTDKPIILYRKFSLLISVFQNMLFVKSPIYLLIK